MSAGPGGEIAERESENRPNHADEKTLQQEDAPHLAWLDAKTHHHRDVACLLHYHHGQCDEDVERSHQHNQGDNDEGDHLFQLERAEELAVRLHPVGGHVALARGLLDGAADLRRSVQVIHFEADHGEQIGLAEEALRVGQAHEGHRRVVLIKT